MRKPPFEILFEDANYVIINKPAPFLSIPDRYDKNKLNLFGALTEKHKEIFLVHRLDKDTSGVISFAKNQEALTHVSTLFEKRLVAKQYLGIVEGSITMEDGVIDAAIRESQFPKGKYEVHSEGKDSITNYKIVERYKGYGLLRYKPLSGRTHQIRIHSAYIGLPILADKLYGYSSEFRLSTIKRKRYNLQKEQLERPLLTRHALHAQVLSFEDSKGTTISAEAPLPKDMRACINQMQKLISLDKSV